MRREVAEAALAHSAGAVERAYQRSDLLTARREVMDAWGELLAEAAPGLVAAGHRPPLRILNGG